MSGSNKETLYTLRAADLSSQTVKEISTQLDKLTISQTRLNESAKAGTATNNDFKASLSSAQALLKALTDQKAIIGEYYAGLAKVEQQSNAVAIAQDKVRAAIIAAQTASDGDFTEKQTKAINRLELQAQSAASKLGTFENNVALSLKSLNQFGVTAETASSAQLELSSVIDKAIPLIKEARIAELGLAEARIANTQRLKEEAAATEVANAATKRKEQADKEAAAATQLLAERQAAADRQVIATRQALQASQDRVTGAFDALPATQAPAQSSTASQPFLAASQAVLGIVNPAQQARQTLAGLDAEIAEIGGTITKTAKRTEDYTADLRKLAVIVGEVTRQAALTDQFKTQEAELKRLDAAVVKAETDIEAMPELFRRMGLSAQESENRIKSQINTIGAARNAYNAQNRALTETGNALKRSGLDYNETEKNIEALAATATRARAVVDASNKAQGGTKGDGTILFGLRGYELTNLSYQVNDVITQLGSGTKPLQVLSQQGGQVFQLFQRDAVAYATKLKDVYGLFPLIGAGAVAAAVGVGVLVLAFKEFDRISARKDNLVSTILGDQSSDVTAERLDKVALSLSKVGVSYSDAAKAARSLAASGFSAVQIEPLVQLSQQLSRATGSSLADSVKEVTSAFTGGYDGLVKFSDTVVRIDAAVLKQAKDLIEAGKTGEAYALVFDSISGRVANAADTKLSGVTRLFNSINHAIDTVLDSLERLSTFIDKNPTLKALFGTDDSAIGKFVTATLGIVGLAPTAPAKPEALSSAIPVNDNSDASNPSTTARANSPAGFAAQRDRAADIAGIKREVFQALQESENNADKNGKFGNGDGAISGTGIGPAQVLKSTFEDLQKRYPALLKGAITDLQTNLTAGALYFREQLNKTGANVEAATNLYKGTSVRPEYAVAARQVALLASRAGNPLTTPQPELGKQTAANPAGVFAEPAKQTEASKTATDNFIDDLKRKTLAIGVADLAGAASAERQTEILNEQDKALRKEAIDYAQQHNTILDQDKLEAAITENRKARISQLQEARLKSGREGRALIESTQEALDVKDPTDLDKVQTANERKFTALRDQIRDKQKGEAGAQDFGGLTPEAAIASLDRLEKQSLAAEYVKSAQAITAEVTKQRDAQIEGIRALKLNVDETTKRISEVTSNFVPKITAAAVRSNEALDRSNKLLGRTNDTDEQKAVRDRNQANINQAARPSGATSSLDELRTQSQSGFDSAATIRDQTVDSIKERVKRGELTLQQAVGEYTRILPGLTDNVRKAFEKSSAELSTLRNSPLTTPEQRSAIDALIQRNKTRTEATGELLKSVLEESLKADQEQFDSLIKQRDIALKAALDSIANNVFLSPNEKLERVLAVGREFNPKIKSSGDKLQAALRTAIDTPGVGVGQRADLQGTLADTTAKSDTNNSDTKNIRAASTIYFKQLDDIRATIKETEAQQRELIVKGVETTEEGEANIAKAYEEANKKAEEIIPTIREIIAALKASGASSTEIDKLTGKLKLFGAETKYASQFQRDLLATITNSFTSRGEQAFDTIGRGLGNLIAGTGSLKEVFQSAGQAFSQFAAGFLQDIAKMILKAILLKAIQAGLNYIAPGSGDAFSAITGAASAAAPAVSGVASAASAAGTVVSKHTGGMVGGGSDRTSRVVDLSLFRDARRMHDGGLVGLAPDEVPAILQQGEEVLSKAQVRDKGQGDGGGSGGGSFTRNVLAVGDDEIAKALAGSHGEKVILNHVRRNAPTIRKLVGGS